MTKKRTRKQKISPHHHFEISWQRERSPNPTEAIVKGQFKNQDLGTDQKNNAGDNADLLTKQMEIEPIRRSVIKTLILAALILGSEVVIYFILF